MSRRPQRRRRGWSRLGTGPPRALVVHAAAKVNVGLQVGDVRPDGFHEVQGLVHTVSLVDRLEIRTIDPDVDTEGVMVLDVAGAPVGLEIGGEEATRELVADENLVFAAAQALAGRLPPRPTMIHLHKAIPVAAGLGGGSADAAGTLIGLNVAWGGRLSAGELVRLGAQIGSDVPPILLGGLVHISGRGEVVRPLGCASQMRFVLGLSRGRISTAEAYRSLDDLRATNPAGRAGHLWANDLEPVAVRLCPEAARGLEAMRAVCDVAFVAGSGPTIVGVVPDPSQAEGVARRLTDAFRRVLVVDPSPWGVRLTFGGGEAE